MIRFLVFVTSVLCAPVSALADILEDASKFTVRIRTSIEYSFAKDDAGTSHGAGFLVDVDNRYLVTNAHVAGRGNANIEIAFKGHEYVSAEAIYAIPSNFAIGMGSSTGVKGICRLSFKHKKIIKNFLAMYYFFPFYHPIFSLDI